MRFIPFIYSLIAKVHKGGYETANWISYNCIELPTAAGIVEILGMNKLVNRIIAGQFIAAFLNIYKFETKIKYKINNLALRVARSAFLQVFQLVKSFRFK
jgi:hypothetical protein